MERMFWKVTRWARAMRVWLLLLLAVLAWLGFGAGEAHAQTAPAYTCIANTGPCNRQEAYDQCEAHAAYNRQVTGRAAQCGDPNLVQRVITCTRQTSAGGWQTCSPNYQFRWSAQECPTGQNWDDVLRMCSKCPASGSVGGVTFPQHAGVYRCNTLGNGNKCGLIGQSCGNKPGGVPGYMCWINIGGAQCQDGQCPSSTTLKSDGMCWPDEVCPNNGPKDAKGQCIEPEICPEGHSKDQFGQCKPSDNQCPPGRIPGPDGVCMDGSDDGMCASDQVRGQDGTCKKDEDGDGQPDDGEDTGKFSGGEDCRMPPQCSGDNIMCGQARIQWRIDCNTRKEANISGGNCHAPPVCAGEGCKPLEYAILVTQWRTACAVEAMAQAVDGPGGGGDDNGPPENFDVGTYAENVVDQAAGSSSGGCDSNGGPGCGLGDREIDAGGDLDDGGLGWGRSCPSLPVVQVMGATLDFNAVAGGKMCDWMQLGGQFVLILAAAASLRIMVGGMG
jgi:hypothetical protein